MTLVYPLAQPQASSFNIVTGIANSPQSTNAYLTSISSYHSFNSFTPVFRTDTGSVVTANTEIYGAYLGARDFLYELIIHFKYRVTGGAMVLFFSIPNNPIAHLERYAGKAILVDPSSSTFEDCTWLGKSTDEISIQSNTSFVNNQDRVFTLHTFFMRDE